MNRIENRNNEVMTDQTCLLIIVSGVHQNQMYVQPSKQLSDDVANTVQGMNSPGNRAYNALDMPRVRWNPYLATCMLVILTIYYDETLMFRQCDDVKKIKQILIRSIKGNL